MKKQYTSLWVGILMLINICSFAQVNPPAPVYPIPTKNQLIWQRMEYYAFIHFSVNTYTNMAWGLGSEDPKIFNPTQLDCRQWARICKEAEMKGIIITAKHHSGFCIWPSKYTDYSVINAPWKNGKGDIMRELADACKEYDLKLGVYLSPWDRNHPDYGRPEYITYFRNQLTELLTNYGDIFEVWYDGANGGTGYYGGANENRKIDRTTYYDWKNTYKLVRKLQPNILIWNDGGDRADLRWVGTEAGYVGETNWSLLNDKGEVPDDMLRHGVENGNAWVPGEVNTSIRPEWFYHPNEDTKVKSVVKLMDTYYQSVGRNGTLLLNFPIMPNGLIHPTDEKMALEFAKARKSAFAKNLISQANVEASNYRGNAPPYSPHQVKDKDTETYWATDDSLTSGHLLFKFKKPIEFNRFVVQEHIALGQRVKEFKLEAMVNGQWQLITNQTTIGYKRILRFNTVKATQIRFSITQAKAAPLLSNIEIYRAPILLSPPSITRNQTGDISIARGDAESVIYYTLDGSEPNLKSTKYTAPVKTTDGKIHVKAITYNPVNKKRSITADEKFEISRKDWSIVGIKNNNNHPAIDGNIYSSSEESKVPGHITIDLGKELSISGFKFLPAQHFWNSGSIVTHYRFSVSNDLNTWETLSEGEFANIFNNPDWQIKTFKPIKTRYIRLTALTTSSADANPRFAEIDIITE